jgi:hypothetical protein
MTKLMLSPTIGRSCDLPNSIKQFLLSEPCTYRISLTKDQMAEASQYVPQEMIDSLRTGTEVVRENITTIYGEENEVISWDAEGERYYIEINDFEKDIDDLMIGTGLRLTLDQTDRNLPHVKEFHEMIFGFPEIDVNDRIGELETTLTPAQEEEIENWK